MSRMSAWWSSLGFGRPPSRPDTDYADMGTAFGLDASFGGEADRSVASGTEGYVAAVAGLESADGQGIVSRKGPARP